MVAGTPTTKALTLMTGHTTHVRSVPFERRFRYGLVLVDLDIDRLAEAHAASPLFAVDRPSLFSFRRTDHGERTASALRPWAEARFANAGIDLGGGSIRLLTMPRHLGYKFSPISVWRGFGPDGSPLGVVYEVNNTFGETHSYVARLDASDGSPARHTADKAFHVSPFFSVDGRYSFTLRTTDPDRFSLIVETRVDGKRSHLATMMATAQPATSANLVKAAVLRPFSSLGVTAAIHWEALWIWRRGAKYRSKPPPPATPSTIAHASPNEIVTKA
ncbi:MAG: DUF1365 domain-containing protein [Pseudomonadota bacterium]